MARIKDSQGIELATGMIVEIENAYFKNDNGLWVIDNAPGDPTWCGSDYSLKKLCKNGKLSTARHTTSFWPLCSFCSDPNKNYAANEHNEKHATITVRDDITTVYVSEHFAKKANGMRETYEWERRMGHSEKVLARELEMVAHYEKLAEKYAA